MLKKNRRFGTGGRPLFLKWKIRKVDPIMKVHPENYESSCGKLGKVIQKIWKVSLKKPFPGDKTPFPTMQEPGY